MNVILETPQFSMYALVHIMAFLAILFFDIQ